MPPPPTLDRKRTLFEELHTRLHEELQTVTHAQQETMAAATHAEATPENDKDTRALESSYLARGLAKRVTELRTSVAQFDNLQPRALAEDSAVVLGALVVVEDEDEQTQHYLLAPAGGGLALTSAPPHVKVITPASPLGRSLLGQRCGDCVDVSMPQGVRQLELLEVG